MKRWSLRARFLLLLIGLLLAIFAAITLVIVNQDSKTLRANLVDESKSFAALATQPIGQAFVLYQNSGTLRIQQQVNSFTELDPHISQVEVVDTGGKRLFTNNAASPIEVSAAAATSLNTTYLYGKDGNLAAVVQPYLEDFGIHRYALVYGISYQSVNQSIQEIVTFIIVLSGSILLASMIAWYFLINRLFLEPIAGVSRLALLISKGELNRQIQLNRNDEIGDLASAVNTMASSLKGDIAKLKKVDELKSEFLIITSHNLRTPITVIKAALEQIAFLKPDATWRKMLDPIRINIMRLGEFSEDVLTMATIEAGQSILHSEPTPIAPVLAALAKDATLVATSKKLHFTATTATEAWVNLSKPHFRTALWNILDNAYKFTAEGGTVTLAVQESAKQLKIVVSDTGVGIAAEEMPRLFTKFHRANDLMAYNYEGVGVGLYISKLIIKQHGGDITAESTQGKGSSFTITLPTVAPPAAAPAAGSTAPAPASGSAAKPAPPASGAAAAKPPASGGAAKSTE